MHIPDTDDLGVLGPGVAVPVGEPLTTDSRPLLAPILSPCLARSLR